MDGVVGAGGGGAFGGLGAGAFACWPGGGPGGGGTQLDVEEVARVGVLCVCVWCESCVGRLLWLGRVGAVGVLVGASRYCCVCCVVAAGAGVLLLLAVDVCAC